MNLLDALSIVRNCSLRSQQMRTKQGQDALKVIDKKLQSLMRKKAWRSGAGTPIHMGTIDFKYPLQETDPLLIQISNIATGAEKTSSDSEALNQIAKLIQDVTRPISSEPQPSTDNLQLTTFP